MRNFDLITNPLVVLLGVIFLSPVLLADERNQPASQIIAECDRLAAFPHDPARNSEGVEFMQIESRAAAGSCRQAVQYSGTPRLQYQFGRSLLKAGDPTALEWIQKAADQGYASAQYSLGWMYADGLGVAKNTDEAQKWYRKAAAQKLSIAAYALGSMYDTGNGVRNSVDEAVSWYRKAAEQGLAIAQYNLGLMYANGRGVEKNFGQAVQWYQLAAQQGFAAAQYALGQIYADGGSEPWDAEAAVKLYQNAAEQGNANAMFALSWMIRSGSGTERNEKSATAMYYQAQRQKQADEQLRKQQRRSSSSLVIKGFSASKNRPARGIVAVEVPQEVATEHQQWRETESSHTVVQTFFATDRNLTLNKVPREMFGANRSEFTYGECYVSIPRDHRMGELESPSWWRLQFSENPEKHVVLLRVDTSSQDQFFSKLAARIKASKKSSAFLFVHGYNVTFEEAARRTAQISYDLGFDGVPVFYSWPSQGSTSAYTIDEQNIEWAQTNLKRFLEGFFAQSEAEDIYLIAHSLGNRALTRAVASIMEEKSGLLAPLKEVILAAPDIDAGVFKRDIAPVFNESGRSVTLYASSGDMALAASKKLHGYPRAGDSGEQLVIVSGIETIDATGMDTSFLGHSYFAENRSLISDIYNLIKGGQRAEQRFGLRTIDTETGRYWEFKQ